jgi:glycosyltransferase involved in cell wall biosynthesis
MSKKIRIIVNAIPLTNINTGIGRYLKCLYTKLTGFFGNELEIGYFDGQSVSSHMPGGPTHQDVWSRKVALFWKLPVPAAAVARMVFHLWREALFRKCATNYDLYHEAAFFPFAPVSGLKTVFTIHDLSLLRFPQYHPGERVFFYRLFFKSRCRGVSSFLTVSEFTRNEVESQLGVAGSRLTVTHLAHDAEVFYPRSPGDVSEFRDRLSLPSQYFAFVGTGDPRKNTAVIPQALRDSGLGVPLVVAGWGGWSHQVDQPQGVISLGYLRDEDLARFYSGALALVYPSLYEGFGLPVLEAMACGCPVICSRRASLPEVAGDAAVYLEDPCSVSELAQALEGVARSEDLRAYLAQKGKRRTAFFSWDRAALETFSVFRELMR